MKRDEELIPLEAERAVLGAVLADQSLLGVVQEILSSQDFGTPAHEAIFSVMVALDGDSRPVDHLSVSEGLKAKGQLPLAGGMPYLVALDQGVPLTHNAPEYARAVKAHAVRRAFVLAGREVTDAALSGAVEADALPEYADKRIAALHPSRSKSDFRPIADFMEPVLDQLDAMHRAGSGVTGLATGFHDLDRMLTGFHPGELIILAARPGIGKTALAMNIAMNVATRGERAAGVFSLEMPAEQLLLRMLASQARVDLKKLRGGRLTPHDEEKFQETAGAVADAPVYIDDSGDMSPTEARAKARRLKAKEPRLGLLVVDYLQLMRLRGKSDSRQAEVGEISRSLKQLAKELEVPVLALSQLNRKVEERKGGKPMLSDLRESGAIEQDADVVMFIHREQMDTEGAEAPERELFEVELLIAKQRNGPIGSVPLLFHGAHTRFESKAQHGWNA
jgi:replicative DNA helicase